MRSCSATRDPRRDNGSRSVRGRQSASQRIPGGLVSHDQAKRFLASPVGIRDMATGSKRAANRIAWSACRASCAWQRVAEAHTAAASISGHQVRLRLPPKAPRTVGPPKGAALDCALCKPQAAQVTGGRQHAYLGLTIGRTRSRKRPGSEDQSPGAGRPASIPPRNSNLLVTAIQSRTPVSPAGAR